MLANTIHIEQKKNIFLCNAETQLFDLRPAGPDMGTLLAPPHGPALDKIV